MKFFTDVQLERYQQLEDKYKALFTAPENCETLVQITVPNPETIRIADQIADPQKMLEQILSDAALHAEIGDDQLPMARVNFGTAQVAGAFGTPFIVLENSLPAAGEPVITSSEAVRELKMPTMQDGWIPKLDAFTDYFKTHLPAGIPIQHPDIQSPFNSAHLIRGNDILFDFYDNPDAVRELLAKVTDFMLAFTRHVKDQISTDSEWFYDMGGLWKGAARISDCSLQMVGPDIYHEFIRGEDIRFMQAIGGGRVHYCGSLPEVIGDFLHTDGIYGVEIDLQYHAIDAISAICPPEKVVRFCDWSTSPGNGSWLGRLLSGDKPKKKNIVINAKADTVREAKRLYDVLKTALA